VWTSHAGQETGHAVADVLFGDHDPSGRLTQTWYASDAGLPSILDYDIAKTGMTYQYYRGKPLYPFGYGLSYTSFRYGAVRASRVGGAVQVSVDVTNTGSRAGTDVVQLYSGKSGVQRLRDFSRVTLSPHETRTVRFSVPVADLATWNAGLDRSVVEQGTYGFSVGRNASDLSAAQPVFVPGERIPARDLSRPTPAQNFDDYSGTTLTDTAKTSGTSVAAVSGSWVAYRDVVLSGPTRLSALVSTVEPSHVTVRLDSPTGRVLGTASVPSTGDRYAYTTVTTALAKVTGRHDVYLTFDGSVNLATFSLR
jgi:beta-glucosidase